MLWLFLCLCSIFPIKAISNDHLYNAMTEDELVFYFQTSDKENIPEYEVVELPIILKVEEITDEEGVERDEVLDYSFSAFQQPVDLKLKRNKDLMASNFKTYLHDEDGVSVFENVPKNCHYLHEGGKTVAAISICSPNNIQGLVFLENATLEVQPLSERILRSVFNVREPLVENLLENDVIKIPHLVKRAAFPEYIQHEAFPAGTNIWEENAFLRPLHNRISDDSKFYSEAATTKEVQLTLEVALFFDEAAYKIFTPFFKHDDKKLLDMLLAYINGVQALYHHPSLGTSLELVVVRLDIMKKQPLGLPHYDGERGKLLDSFCAYQEKINPKEDSDPNHWDMGLYVSGLDFFAYEKGKRSGVTMGLATVGGVCLDKYACVIAEFGTTNAFGKPYPSAGFTSVYILAHEIGHNLGMHHDSSANSCPKEGYIMSPSRGTNGETQWSSCSATVMTQLGWAKCLEDRGKQAKDKNHAKFLDTPGQKYTAKTQCQILLRDRDATVLPNQDLSTICYNLQCKTPHRSGYYFAGPALEGTNCGNGKYCYGGNCLKKSIPKPLNVVPGGWSQWKEDSCNSGCIEKSMGYTTKRRLCNNPPPVNTDQGCVGSTVEFGLCNDNKVCKSKKLAAVDYASNKCAEFSKVVPELDSKGSGLQAPHEEGRLWMGCAIFCKRADSGTFYTPRIELNDLGISPYFPDGTWCNRDNNVNFYCLQHHCLPENFKITKTGIHLEDLSFLQNAHPWSHIPQEIIDYLSLDSYGRPLKTTLSENGAAPPPEYEWEDRDYIEIPWLKERNQAVFDENLNLM